MRINLGNLSFPTAILVSQVDVILKARPWKWIAVAKRCLTQTACFWVSRPFGSEKLKGFSNYSESRRDVAN